MSTSSNLPVGAFITTLGGKRCTAVPRTDVSSTQAATSTSTSASSSSSSTSDPSSSSSDSSYFSYSSSASAPSSSTFTSTSISEAQVLEPPQVQATTAAPATVAPPAEATTSSSSSVVQFSAISSATGTTASVAVTSKPQASVADTSIAALSTPASTTITTAPKTTSASPIVVAISSQSEVFMSSSTTGLMGISTMPRPGSGTVSSGLQAPDSTGANVSGATAVSSVSAKGGGDVHGSSSTIAVAGGVIGGLAVAGLLAFLIWLWKRRIQKRRSTLHTPLSADPSFGGEKGETERGDRLRPKPNSSKFKASVRAQYDRFRDRKASSASPTYDYSIMCTKERIRKIWAGLRGSQRRGSRLNENRKDMFAARAIRGGMKEVAKPRSRPLPANKPDSLMDDGILDSEAQRRRLSRFRGGSLGTALSGLALNSGDDPFSDVNAAKYTSANPPTHFATGADDPFSDANVIGERGYIPKPSAYGSDVPHSRGRSVDSTVALSRAMRVRAIDGVPSRPPSNSTAAYAESSLYLRDSASSFDTRRNRFRSDPFDLEPLSQSHNMYGLTAAVSSDLSTVSRSGIRRIPSNNSQRYQQSMGPIGGNLIALEGDNVRRPIAAARATYDSLGSSRYTSGVSQGTVDDWPEPGPDIGPTALWSGAGQSSSTTGS